MNLIAYPAWTCGGLLCDILNKTLSPVDKNGGIGLPYHKGLLIVHGGNTNDNSMFKEKVKTIDLTEDIWVGTHTYPDEIDITYFNKVIVVNLTTCASITYRYARILYQCLYGNGINGNRKPSEPDTWRCPAFNKIFGDNVDNIEFEDVVKWNKNLVDLLDKHCNKEDQSFIDNRKRVWTTLNKFLYDRDYIESCNKRLNIDIMS